MKTLVCVLVLLISGFIHAAEPTFTNGFVAQWRKEHPGDPRSDFALTIDLGFENPDALAKYPDFKAEFDAILAPPGLTVGDKVIRFGYVLALLALMLAFRKRSTRRPRALGLVQIISVLLFVATLFNAPWRMEKRFGAGISRTSIENGPLWSPPFLSGGNGSVRLEVGTLAMEWIAIGLLAGIGLFVFRKKKEQPPRSIQGALGQ